MIHSKLFAWCIALVTFSAVVFADARRPPLICLGGGIVRPAYPKVAFELEARGTVPRLPWLRPQIGILTTEFNSAYAYLGAAIDFFLFRNLAITPSFSPGLYFRGNGIDLGSVVEFRSAFEAALVLENGIRIGGEFFHISNGHLSRKNPGSNAVMIRVEFPFSFCLPRKEVANGPLC